MGTRILPATATRTYYACQQQFETRSRDISRAIRRPRSCVGAEFWNRRKQLGCDLRNTWVMAQRKTACVLPYECRGQWQDRTIFRAAQSPMRSEFTQFLT
jgi:hypothetical protein